MKFECNLNPGPSSGRKKLRAPFISATCVYDNIKKSKTNGSPSTYEVKLPSAEPVYGLD
jgi:hypothetical protein